MYLYMSAKKNNMRVHTFVSTFNNISVWRSVLLVEKSRLDISSKNYQIHICKSLSTLSTIQNLEVGSYSQYRQRTLIFYPQKSEKKTFQKIFRGRISWFFFGKDKWFDGHHAWHGPVQVTAKKNISYIVLAFSLFYCNQS